VVEGFTTTEGRFYSDAQHLLEFTLADVLSQALRPQAVIGPNHLFFWSWLRIHQRCFATGGLATGAGRDNRHRGKATQAWITSVDAGNAMAKGGVKKAAAAAARAAANRLMADNRQARHQYEILETLETGIELVGTEVKSIRNWQSESPRWFLPDSQRRTAASQRAYLPP
jgi:hypothetical protein